MPVGSGGLGGGSAADVRAGGAFVEITGRDKLSPVLNRIKRNVLTLSSVMKAVGGATLGAGLGLAAPLAALFKGGLDRAAQVGEIAEQFDLTAESVSRLVSAFEQGGVPAEDFAEALKGLSQKNTGGQALDTLVLDVVDALNDIPDGAKRAAAAMETFGEAGVKLLRAGRGLRERFNAADPITTEQVKQAREVQAAWTKATTAVQLAMLPVLKIITPLAKKFSEFAVANAGVVLTLTGVAAGLVTFGTVAWGLGATLGAVVGTIGAAGTALSALATPIGVASLALVGLGALFATQTETGKKMAADLGEAFKNLGEIFRDTWGGVIDAVKAGNLELAFKIVGVGIKTVWAQVMLSLRQGWNDFMVWTVDSLRKNPWILPLIGGIVGGLVGGGPGALAGAAAGAGGAAALEFFADEIKRGLTADTTDAMKRLIAARGELAGLRAEAARGVAGNFDDDKYLQGSGGMAAARMSAANFEATKGAFDTFRTSALRFGYGDTAKKELTLLERIAEGKGALADKIADALAGSLVPR